MSHVRFAPCVALLVLLALPAAAAAPGTVVLQFDNPGTLRLIWDGDMDGEQSQQTRAQIDQSMGGGTGNGDGTVTQEEVDAFENQLKSFFDQIGEDGDSSGDSFTIDGKNMTDFNFKNFDLRNAPGPVSSANPIGVHAELEFVFPVEAGSKHTMRVEGGDEREEDEEFFGLEIASATLKAPSGYIIESATGLPAGASVSGDKKSINFGTSYVSTSDMTIVLSKGGGGSPGTALVGAVVALLVGALVWRGRRPLA